jgi:hypothetical protein
MRTLKTKIPESITSFEAAKQYLTDLHANGEEYHPEDEAGDCLQGISVEVASHMNNLMDLVYKFFGENGANPCAFLLELDGHNIED